MPQEESHGAVDPHGSGGYVRWSDAQFVANVPSGVMESGSNLLIVDLAPPRALPDWGQGCGRRVVVG